ncbi:hypothetical protein [Roseivirga pacifica]|uniref:hypothetical protein n=1 Tax=Roseivirga pacifica TaxID=1267423 RepID=UPI003BA8F09E
MAAIRVSLKRRLKAFREPDTRKRSVGYAEGTYVIHDKRRNYPTEDTDYVQIEHPDLGEVWLCTRWMQTSYAEFKEVARNSKVENSISKAISQALGQIGANDTSHEGKLCIEERMITDLLPNFRAFVHNLSNTTYPFPINGLNIKVGPPYLNNCCAFVEALLVQAWSANCTGFKWSASRHAQMMILSDSDFFSPVSAAVESGMARLNPNFGVYPAPWSLLQVWREKWSEGQTMLIVDCHLESGKVLVLESNDKYGLNGVGFRGIGMLRDMDSRPPANWWQLPGVWTWDQLKAAYPFRKMAALKVKNRSWSGL